MYTIFLHVNFQKDLEILWCVNIIAMIIILKYLLKLL